MSFYEEIKENLTTQLLELEVLQSVYPKELIITDHGTLADINCFIERMSKELPQRLEYLLELPIANGMLELEVSLPCDYPFETPEVYARMSLLDRTQQMLLNKALVAQSELQEKGEPCIYALIAWLQDNIESYIKVSKGCHKRNTNENKNKSKSSTSAFARYWIYSHHIYSKFKRRDITSIAKENSLTGFCLAGKPGIVCIEGTQEDCEYCWQKVKTMNWHKILVKFIETFEMVDNKDAICMRKFSDFEEVSFPSSDRHSDMGQLLKYLTKHNCQHAFKELFGIEGKSVNKTGND
ncbi:RWD domain-containing protein 2A [Prorops nasuta]|uniref:RWD domain-containing protein 2A n=1 Tax=Prorops nasuta TaxID=863751 RepID=UPI0034CF538A